LGRGPNRTRSVFPPPVQCPGLIWAQRQNRTRHLLRLPSSCPGLQGLGSPPSRPVPPRPPRAAMPPSKGKKKNQSTSPRPSPRTPSSCPSAGSGTGDGERSVDLPSIAAAAAEQFPALVPRGGSGYFAGIVAEVAPRDGSRGGRLGRLWLSEAAMVGAGMRPGCFVSVSLCLLLF
jgi:hypothetical protein